MVLEKRKKAYRITVYCGSDNNGKAIRQSVTFKPDCNLSERQQYKQAYNYGLELENKIKQGVNLKYDRLTFSQFCEMYFNNHLPTLKENTATQYKQITEKRLLPYFANMRMINISSLDVIQWLASLEKDKNSNRKTPVLSENSKGVYFRTLSSLFGVAVKWGVIRDNPCKRVTMPHQQTTVKALQQNEVNRLFSLIDSYPDYRVVIVVYILLLTGIRISELIGLQWGDINFDNQIISIKREVIHLANKGTVITPPKSYSSNRDIFVPELLINKLRAYQALQQQDIINKGDLFNNQDYIITQFNGNPVYISTVRKWLKKAFTAFNIPYVTIHGLRHTYASLLISNGIDARTTASQLGHNTPSLVMNVYANPQNIAKRQSANLLEKIIKNPDN